jgi:hypothetical protein
MTLVRQADDVNARTIQLVKLLTEVGPDVPEISRRLGQFKESVRYRYNEKILSKGFAVQCAVDHEKLGLRRLVLIVDIAEPYSDYAPSIFAAMNETSFVISFAKVIMGGKYLVNVSAPARLINDVEQFFLRLRDMGMFASLEILEFDWFRNVPMKAEYYDFDTGRWDFDWGNASSAPFDAAAYQPSSQTKFDKVDLLLLKEFTIDANKSLKEISDKLGVNYKKLAWHYSTHVWQRKLQGGYTVNWMGTRYDYTIEKALHRKHRYLGVGMTVKDVTPLEMMTLREAANRLPFIWAEAAGKDFYAEFTFPIDFAVEAFQYLGRATMEVKDRASIYIIDQTEAARFTISYQLYDDESKMWKFDQTRLIEQYKNLLMKIKE